MLSQPARVEAKYASRDMRKAYSESQKIINLTNPGFSELSRSSLVFIDFILSRGAQLPDIITNEKVLESFEYTVAHEASLDYIGIANGNVTTF